MAISFESVPLGLLTPGVFVEITNKRAVKGVAVQPHVSLLIGQMSSAGSATAAVPVAVDTVQDADILFGATANARSQLAAMVAAYKQADPLTELWCIPLADAGSSVAATGNIVFTGTATESRELPFYVAGIRVPVAVTKGDTAAVIETNAIAAFALATGLPVTVAADAAAGLDFTAYNTGTAGNQIFIGVCQLPGERPPSGITFTVTAMASGATDPSYAGAVSAMAEDWYNTIACGVCAATPVGLLITELESRFGPTRMIDGQLFAAFADTRANLTTLGNAFNSKTFSLLGLEVSALLRAPWEIAAATAGVNAAQAQVDPSRVCTGLPVPGFYGAKKGTRFTRAQQNILLSDGVSTFDVSSDGRLQIQRLVTTYQVNAQSLPDTSYQDVNPTMRTLSALRYSTRVRISTTFARFKLAADGTPIAPGQPIATPKIVRGEMCALFLSWQDLGWVQNYAQFSAELIVELNTSVKNRMDILLPPDLIQALLVSAVQIAFA